jgi:hypothetical protein
MIYRNVGAGLVDAQLPDNTQLMKGAVPDVQKMKAAAWGLPELDDFGTPKLEYEKDISTRAAEDVNAYYNKMQDLMGMAVKLRSVGIDVTNPDPMVPNSVEAAALWNQDKNDAIELGKQLKRSREEENKLMQALLKPNVFTIEPPAGKAISDASQYMLDFERKPIDQTISSFKSSWSKPIYGEQDYNNAVQDVRNAEDAITRYYDKYIELYPQFADKLEVSKDADVAAIKGVLRDNITDKKLAQKWAEEQGRMARFIGSKETEKVGAGVLEQFYGLADGTSDVGMFYGYVTNEPIMKDGKQKMKDGAQLYYTLGNFLPNLSNKDFLVFEKYDDEGNPRGTIRVQYAYKGNRINPQTGQDWIKGMPTYQTVLQQTTPKAPFAGPYELPIGTNIPKSQYNYQSQYGDGQQSGNTPQFNMNQ